MIVSDPHMPHGERTKLLDFGIAKFTGNEDVSQTRTQVSAVMGSPSYMSPEQCRGAGLVDDRTDVYALGCMIYEMLSGRPPFVGESMAEVMGKHQFEPPVPLGKRTAGVPAALLVLVDRLLIKDRALRPTMSQLLEGLETLREQLPQIRQRRSARFPLLRAPSDAATVRHFSTLGQSVGQGLRKLHKTPRALVILTAALLTLAVLTPLLLHFRQSHPAAPQVGVGKVYQPVIPAALPKVEVPIPNLQLPAGEDPGLAEPPPASIDEPTSAIKTTRGDKRHSSSRPRKHHQATPEE